MDIIPDKVKINRFKGNQFDIVFLVAQEILYHASHINELFTNYHEPSNKLQQLVFSDSQGEVIMAGCKVLQPIAKLITGELWRLYSIDR